MRIQYSVVRLVITTDFLKWTIKSCFNLQINSNLSNYTQLKENVNSSCRPGCDPLSKHMKPLGQDPMTILINLHIFLFNQCFMDCLENMSINSAFTFLKDQDDIIEQLFLFLQDSQMKHNDNFIIPQSPCQFHNPPKH